MLLPWLLSAGLQTMSRYSMCYRRLALLLACQGVTKYIDSDSPRCLPVKAIESAAYLFVGKGSHQ